MPKKVIQTVLPKELDRLFEEKWQESGMTKYKFLQKIVADYLNPPKIERLDQVPKTDNFEEQVKIVAESDIPTSMIEEAIEALDKQKKTKNSMKKGGAYHEMNAVLDIRNMVIHAKPNYFELKYHFDWWYRIGVLTNALARRGLTMKPKHARLLKLLEERPEALDPYSELESAMDQPRANMRRARGRD